MIDETNVQADQDDPPYVDPDIPEDPTDEQRESPKDDPVPEVDPDTDGGDDEVRP